LKTNIGSTWIAKGSVDVLAVNGSDFVVQTQNKDNLTLYIFDNDVPGQSACTSAQCVTAWPPLLAKAIDVATPPLSIITRADGKKQWALRDKPLYFFVGDANPGDIKGEGVGTIWHVALTQPVLRNKPTVSEPNNDFLVSSGNLLVGMPSGGNTKFVGERHDRNGFTLYTFDTDTSGVSNCTGGCLAAWPPLLADANDVAAPPYSIIDRSMGTNPTAKQWAYYGKPLYFYVGDTTAGDVTGANIPKWHLVAPKIELTSSTADLGSFLVASGLVKMAVPVNGVETTSSVARDGFTLYTFDSDTTQNSNCTDACLTNWPALIIDPNTAGFTLEWPYSFTYRTGAAQLTLNGSPLYFFAGDTQAGQTKGEGVGGKWVVARAIPVAVKNHPTKGKIFVAHSTLTDGAGGNDNAHAEFTLYTFDKDPIGQSTCVGGCLAAWPPLHAGSEQPFGDFTVITRDATTGAKQWAYKGKPLYFYVGDSAPGDVAGEYTDWTIARP
jgi:predicted lipoprotein with Yx(FWY)xxD motif